jgi:hypothetical protein
VAGDQHLHVLLPARLLQPQPLQAATSSARVRSVAVGAANAVGQRVMPLDAMNRSISASSASRFTQRIYTVTVLISRSGRGRQAWCDLLHTPAHRGGLASRRPADRAAAGDVDMAGSPRALSLASVGAGHDVRIKTERWHTYPRPSICRVFAERNVSAQKPGCLARDENGLDGSMQTGTSMSGTSGTVRSKGTISEGAIPASLITSPDEKQRKPCRGDEWSHRHAHHAPPHWLR